MKGLIKYNFGLQSWYVSVGSLRESDYCKNQLSLRNIECEFIDYEKLNRRDRAAVPKADYSFEKFKKNILK